MHKNIPRIKAVVFACIAVVAMSGAWAQTPMAKDPSPGWYRMRLGTFEVTALSDGTLEMPVDKVFSQISPARIRSLLSRSYLTNEVVLTVNAFLVNTGAKLILIDTGTGTSQMFGPKLGSLLANLKASGYSPEQVDEIYATPMHTDPLIRMANQIGSFFEAMPDRAEALEGIVQHIRKFWDPRMRRAFLQVLDEGDNPQVSEMVLASVHAHRALLA